MGVDIRHGDAMDILASLDDASIDAVVTDPPYGLADTTPGQVSQTLSQWLAGRRDFTPSRAGFMGHGWDCFVPPPALWDQVARVLKPGGHALVFAGTRTQHLMGVSLALAGFEVRDCLTWLYATGFPKARGVLKPGHEPILVARKPPPGATNACVAAHGTGMLNTDACRVAFASAADQAEAKAKNAHLDFGSGTRDNAVFGKDRRPRGTQGNWDPPGRWPANVVVTHSPGCAAGVPAPDRPSGSEAGHGRRRCEPGCPAAALDAQSGRSRSRRGAPRASRNPGGTGFATTKTGAEYDDEGGASRFFPTFHYQGRALPAERPRYLREDGTPVVHTTVKPLDLMRWLVRLATPAGGVVLDPFAGSGATIEAAMMEGLDCVGIERESDYLPLIGQRVGRAAAALAPPTRAAP